MIEVGDTTLAGVRLIKPHIFEDHRGWYVETYNEEEFHAHGMTVRFVQDDISVSHRNVLRGIHGDRETWKLVSCLHGEFYLVVVNCDRDSGAFGRWESFTLNDVNRQLVLIPPGYGNGHVVLSERAIFHYKQSTYYNPGGQFTCRWNDPELGIRWPVTAPILSRRDEVGTIV